MNLITRNTDYAIRALIYMAGAAPELVSATDLVRDLGLPRPFIRKILQELQKAGFLYSIKGKNGGFQLAVAPEKLRLVDLILLFQGPVSMGDCLLRKKICACTQTCPLRLELKKIEAMAVAHLQNVTVAFLMKG